MDLASYLLKPVQRMGKYALLLKQLLKESGDKEPEFVDLLAAEQMVRFQLRHGNDLLAMDSLRDCDVNVKEQGRLIRQSEFYCWQGRKKGLRHVFLFEDLILFSKAKRDPERKVWTPRQVYVMFMECDIFSVFFLNLLSEKNLDIYIYKHSMKTSDIGFTAKMGESSTRFEIWFRKRKPNETIVMEATNPDVKQSWVEDISRILWKQALRNRGIWHPLQLLFHFISYFISKQKCVWLKWQKWESVISRVWISDRVRIKSVTGQSVTPNWLKVRNIFLRNRCKNVLKIGFNFSAQISTLCLRINSVR